MYRTLKISGEEQEVENCMKKMCDIAMDFEVSVQE